MVFRIYLETSPLLPTYTQNYEEKFVFAKFPPFYPNIDYVCLLEPRVLCNLFPFSPSKLPSFAFPFFCLVSFKPAYCLAALFSCRYTWSEQTQSVKQLTVEKKGLNTNMLISVCSADLWYCVMFFYFCYCLLWETRSWIDIDLVWNASEDMRWGEGASFSCDLSLACCSGTENSLLLT